MLAWLPGMYHVAHRHKRSIGIGATWIAALALVLNVVLSSALLASISPTSAFADGHPICLNGAASGTIGDDSDQTGKTAGMQCPLCIGNHVAGTPPPSAPAILDRVAGSVSPAFIATPLLIALQPGRDQQPRGPPQSS